MGEPPTWHGFRRTLAWAAMCFWLLIALVPMIALIVQGVQGSRTGADLIREVVRIGIPAVLYTVAVYYAVLIYRAGSPDESRAPAWKLGAAFLLGYVVYIGTSMLMNP